MIVMYYKPLRHYQLTTAGTYPDANVLTSIIVLDLVSQVRDVVLMNVYLDLGNPGGVGILE